MDANAIVDLLNQLDRVPADSLETPTLDFKEWDRRGMNMAVEATIEHVVCMANGGGGTLILGVHDKKKGRKQAILGVPPEVDANTLRKSIYDKTSPQIMPSIKPLRVAEGTGRLLVIEVQGDFPPYTDSQGRAKICVGKECLPLTGPRLQNLMATRGNDDPTAREIVGKLGDLISPVAMESLRGMAAQSAPDELLSLSDRDLLRSIGLISEKGYLRSAGLLLVGKPERIEEFFPSYQWAFLRMSSSTDYENVERDRTSLALAVPKIEFLITPYNPVTTVEQGLLHLEFRKYPMLAIREALMNAFAHANYRIPGVIQVQISEESLEITNPGGFIGGINESNFLRHAPVARNATLMSALISLSLDPCMKAPSTGGRSSGHRLSVGVKARSDLQHGCDALRVCGRGSEGRAPRRSWNGLR